MVGVIGRGFWQYMGNETWVGRRKSKVRRRSAIFLVYIGMGAIMNNRARTKRETRAKLSKENGQRTGETSTKRLFILRPRETKPQYRPETL